MRVVRVFRTLVDAADSDTSPGDLPIVGEDAFSAVARESERLTLPFELFALRDQKVH